MGTNGKLIPEAMIWNRAFVDGGAEDNGRRNCRAAWAYQIGDDTEPVAGPVTGPPTPTNNRAEFLAILNLLKALIAHRPPPRSVLIVTDSDYCKQSLTMWRHKWKLNGWRRKGGDLANADLIKELDGLIARAGFRIAFVHVTSHRPKPKNPALIPFWEGNNSVDIAAGLLIKNNGSDKAADADALRPSKRRSVMPASAPAVGLVPAAAPKVARAIATAPTPAAAPTPVTAIAAPTSGFRNEPRKAIARGSTTMRVPSKSASATRKTGTTTRKTVPTPSQSVGASLRRRLMKRQLS